jgi:flagellar P-ring protein precursor FlgI
MSVRLPALPVLTLALAAVAAGLGELPARAATVAAVARIKDAQEQQIFGVGLVVGLRGTGDKGRETQRRLAQYLSIAQLSIQPGDLAPKNVALVFVTARVKPFAKQGESFDVTVSSMGDAASLQGGVLLPTPMQAGKADVVYARAQGDVEVAGADGTVTHPTAGTVTGGAILEKEIPCAALEKQMVTPDGRRVDYVDLTLQNGDASLASAVADGINTWLRKTPENPAARALDPNLVRVEIPEIYRKRKVDFLDDIMKVPVVSEPPATVTINERTGAVVVTGAVKVSPVTVSVGSLKVYISEEGSFENLQKAMQRTHSNAEFIAVIKELKRAGALQARLVTQ